MSTIQLPPFEVGTLAKKLLVGVAIPVAYEMFQGWPPVFEPKTMMPFILIGVMTALGIDVQTFSTARKRAAANQERGDR